LIQNRGSVTVPQTHSVEAQRDKRINDACVDNLLESGIMVPPREVPLDYDFGIEQ
jgi:hypothetical protein